MIQLRPVKEKKCRVKDSLVLVFSKSCACMCLHEVSGQLSNKWVVCARDYQVAHMPSRLSMLWLCLSAIQGHIRTRKQSQNFLQWSTAEHRSVVVFVFHLCGTPRKTKTKEQLVGVKKPERKPASTSTEVHKHHKHVFVSYRRITLSNALVTSVQRM